MLSVILPAALTKGKVCIAVPVLSASTRTLVALAASPLILLRSLSVAKFPSTVLEVAKLPKTVLEVAKLPKTTLEFLKLPVPTTALEVAKLP